MRLPESLLAALDTEVREGRAASRTSVIKAAIERELRERLYERDNEILTPTTSDGLDAVVASQTFSHLSELD